MPTRHGIDVTVVTTDGQPFMEYGIKNLSRPREKSKIVSTSIEAQTGETFHILIRPETPFPFDKDEQSDTKPFFSPDTRHFGDDHNYGLRSRRADHERPIEEVRETEGSTKQEQEQEQERSLDNQRNLRPRTSRRDRGARNTRVESPPFDLSAFVYIDGHEKPECRQIIYLNPSNPKHSPQGCVLRGRWVAVPTDSKDPESSAQIEIRSWVFTSVGIDLLLSRLDMNATSPEEGPRSGLEREVDELTSMMTANEMAITQRPKPGQIEVRLARIYTGESRSNSSFDAHHYAGSEEVDSKTMMTDNVDCTHTMTLRAESKEAPVSLNTVKWRYYKKNEEMYARFVFQYMGRGKLVRMGLCNEHGTPTFEGRVHASQEGKKTARTTTSWLRKRTEDEDKDEDYLAALNAPKKRK